MQIIPVKKRFWWPHPYARPLLWRKRTIAYKYVPPEPAAGEPIPPLPDEFLTWPGKELGHPKPAIIWYGHDDGANAEITGRTLAQNEADGA